MREVRVSSPDRVLWPAAGMADGKPVTKLDVAHYPRRRGRAEAAGAG